jgi:hypothetical protein
MAHPDLEALLQRVWVAGPGTRIPVNPIRRDDTWPFPWKPLRP